LCIEGSFLSNGNGARLSKAGIFAKADSPVIGRFSTGGGQPYARDGPLFAFLRQAHTVLAMTLFATILAHLGAALFHAWIRRDGVWQAMALGRSQRRPPTSSMWASRSAGSS
jgi:hypothetical protein